MPRRRVVVVVLLIVLAAAGVGGGGLGFWLQADQESTRADAAVVTAEDLCDQVEALGGECVRDPGQLKGDPGPEGPPGPAGTDITGMACVGGAFVVTYSDGTVESFGDCIAEAGPSGDDGSDGTNGENGADGTDGEPGAAGPSGPAGEQGPAGEDGADGEDGRGITSAKCNDDGDLIITYTDGTTENAGSCRLL